jgi:hypothetical protein
LLIFVGLLNFLTNLNVMFLFCIGSGCTRGGTQFNWERVSIIKYYKLPHSCYHISNNLPIFILSSLGSRRVQSQEDSDAESGEGDDEAIEGRGKSKRRK